MSFYEMFLMISYFATFVYHILIYHFSILQDFLKKTIYYFLKKQSYFYTKLSFQVTEIDLGYSRACSIIHGWDQYYKHIENMNKLNLCFPSPVPEQMWRTV